MKTNLLKQVFLLAVLFTVALYGANHKAATALKPAGKTNAGQKTQTKQVALPDFQVLNKQFNYEEMHSGDCVIGAGNTLDVFSDGHAEFRATVWTNHTHSGDTWHHHILLKNAAGVVIFQINLEGPNHMNDNGSRYGFSANFNFPAGIFGAITFVTEYGEC